MSDEPIVVFASFQPLPGKEEDLHALLSWMVEHTRPEPGCDRYDLYRERETGQTFHLIERYRDEDALAAHRGADYFLEYRRRVSDLIEGSVGVVVLRGLDVAG
jgi:quinol monooxygenase YgiN